MAATSPAVPIDNKQKQQQGTLCAWCLEPITQESTATATATASGVHADCSAVLASERLVAQALDLDLSAATGPTVILLHPTLLVQEEEEETMCQLCAQSGGVLLRFTFTSSAQLSLIRDRLFLPTEDSGTGAASPLLGHPFCLRYLNSILRNSSSAEAERAAGMAVRHCCAICGERAGLVLRCLHLHCASYAHPLCIQLHSHALRHKLSCKRWMQVQVQRHYCSSEGREEMQRPLLGLLCADHAPC
jgi:hypothetical protein